MIANRALYLRRRVANYAFIALSLGAALFGLVWLGFGSKRRAGNRSARGAA